MTAEELLAKIQRGEIPTREELEAFSASPGPLPGPCFLLGTVKFKPQPWFNWNVTGSIVWIGVFFSLPCAVMKWSVPGVYQYF